LLIVKGENVMSGSAPELATRADGADPDAGEPDRRDRVAELEQEGEIAADYLEAFLDIVDMDGDLDLDVEGERAVVAIVGDSLDKLIGAGGETLEALQELTRLAVLQKTGNRSRLMLDVGGHRARRRAELRKIATAAAQRVADGSGPEKLTPMTPFERKVVHDVIAGIDGVHSESEGEEPRRRVVLFPGDAS
jgi:spoIIIJ-associated protein